MNFIMQKKNLPCTLKNISFPPKLKIPSHCRIKRVCRIHFLKSDIFKRIISDEKKWLFLIIPEYLVMRGGEDLTTSLLKIWKSSTWPIFWIFLQLRCRRKFSFKIHQKCFTLVRIGWKNQTRFFGCLLWD